MTLYADWRFVATQYPLQDAPRAHSQRHTHTHQTIVELEDAKIVAAVHLQYTHAGQRAKIVTPSLPNLVGMSPCTHSVMFDVLWMDDRTTLIPGTIICWYLRRGVIIPGFLRWCEMDFDHPH